MTRYFYDTEFLEDGKTIELISIGIVADDGREYYAVNADMPVERIKADRWLVENVWKALPVIGYQEHLVTVGVGKNEIRCKTPGFIDRKSVHLKPRWVIANEVREFLLSGCEPAGEKDGEPFYFDTDIPELWAYYAAYDHVALAQLFGKMIHLPTGIPMWTNDIMQLAAGTPKADLPKQADGEHNTLADARHNKVMFDFLMGGDRS